MKPSIVRTSLTGLIISFTGLLLFAFNSPGAPPQSGSQSLVEPKRSEYIYVDGEVKNPSRYTYTNGMTLVSAINRAGGVSEKASQSAVTLTRKGEQPVTLDRQAIEQGKAKDVELLPGDKVFVPRK